jgi:hypothetical protein
MDRAATDGSISLNEVPRYLIRDRDGIYGAAVTRRLRAMGIRDKPIAPGSIGTSYMPDAAWAVSGHPPN